MEKQRYIFDLDGTLIVPDYSYEREYFMSVLSKDDAKRLIPMIPKLLASYEISHPRYDKELLSKYISKTSGVLITSRIIEGWVNAYKDIEPVVIDEVIETLDYLHYKDKSLGILTNWFLEAQINRLRKSNLFNYFDGIYGGEIASKPNPLSYKIACGKYSIDECIMIGDSLENDVYGAMNIGMDSIYYNPKNNNNFDKNKVKSIGRMSKIRELV